jgi:hypothetical protein
LADVKGMLEGYFATAVSPDKWELQIRIGGKEYFVDVKSPIAFPVLASALLMRKRWKVQLSIADRPPHILGRVRVLDDREVICKGDLPDQPANQAYLPLSPTLFGDEDPPKWGFFFSVKDKCKEHKGISLDVYTVIARAWKNKNTVTLIFDGDLIVGARCAAAEEGLLSVVTARAK